MSSYIQLSVFTPGFYMQGRFIELQKALAKIDDALFGMSPEPIRRTPNRGVHSDIFYIPEAPNSGGSPDQFSGNTDLILINEPVKGDESSEQPLFLVYTSIFRVLLYST